MTGPLEDVGTLRPRLRGDELCAPYAGFAASRHVLGGTFFGRPVPLGWNDVSRSGGTGVI
jgi:hypothetical protein